MAHLIEGSRKWVEFRLGWFKLLKYFCQDFFFLYLSVQFSSILAFLSKSIFPKWWLRSWLATLDLHFIHFSSIAKNQTKRKENQNNTSFQIKQQNPRWDSHGFSLSYTSFSEFHWGQGEITLTGWAWASDCPFEPKGSIKIKLHTPKLRGSLVALKKIGVFPPSPKKAVKPTDPITSKNLEWKNSSAHMCSQTCLSGNFVKQLEKSAVNLDELFCCFLFPSKVLEVCWCSSLHLCWALTLCLVLKAEEREEAGPSRNSCLVSGWEPEHATTLLSCPPPWISIFHHSSQIKLGPAFSLRMLKALSPSSPAGRHIMKRDVPSETKVRNPNCMASHKPH